MLQIICGIIEQAIKQMEVLKGDIDEKQTRKILEDKKQELLEQVKLVLPEEKFFEGDSKDEEVIIKELATIQVKLELYAYKNRDQIDGLRKQVEEIKAQEKTEKNREELLQKIKELETRYKVFERYIKEEDWKKFYRTKFDVLMCDINQRTESPLFVNLLVVESILKPKKENERELEHYRKYIQEKINNILLGKNKEVERVFLGEQIYDERNKAVKLGAATELIKRIIKIQSGFDLNSILRDRDILSLILAFDKKRGIEEMTVADRIVRRARNTY